ncbi:competence protein [Lonepinella sp. MS14437]|uniref:competence protein n=1 Tax=Lonepinella sp. MS14437 TaxID=3003620 RepID=UPI0036DEC1DB
MHWTILNNPENLWGKWLKLSYGKHLISFILLGIVVLYFPLFQGISHYYLFTQTEQQTIHIQQDLEHKQQLLQGIKQQMEQHLLTPELANQLPPINQTVQQLSGTLQFENHQWIFNQKPQLTLHIQGYFSVLTHFITALLAQHNALHLVSLQIRKAENIDYSIESDVIFQLNFTQHQREK